MLNATLVGAAEPPEIGGLEVHDPAFHQLVPQGAKIEVLADGFLWSEGPVWSGELGGLLFSDIPRNRVLLWKPETGVAEFLVPAGYTGADPRGGESGSNGLTFDSEGRLVLCQHGDRCVARLDSLANASEPRYHRLAERYQGKRFNSPNDLVFDASGALFFTDPPYGLERQAADPLRELDFCGVYRLDSEGSVHLLIRDLSRPNGIAFSPDEQTLYVANSDPERAIWMAYGVRPDGSLDEGRLFFDATELAKTRRGLPDGLKVDPEGNLFATGPGGVLVFSAEGKHLGTISTGESIANCAFGPEGDVLYMTSHRLLCRVALVGAAKPSPNDPTTK